MYRKLTSENKKYGMLAIFAVFLFSFVFAIILNNLPASAITSTKASGLWSGTNVNVSVYGLGTEVSNKNNKESASDFEYAAVLPFEYQRAVTNGIDAEENIQTVQQGATQYFSMEFYITKLGSDTMAMEFTDYQNDKKAVRIEFDLSGFKPADADAGTADSFVIDAYLSVTTDKWKTPFVKNDTNKTTFNLSGFFHGSYPAEIVPEDVLQSVRFTLSYTAAGGFNLSLHERDTSGETEVFNPIDNKSLWASSATRLFIHDTAKMRVEYTDGRFSETPDPYGGTMKEYFEHAVTFSRINGQTLAADVDGEEPEPRQLPVISKDKKVEEAKYSEVIPSSESALYSGLRASRKTTVTFPVLITDAVNFSIYSYVEIWKANYNATGNLEGMEKIDTKTFSVGSSGISYYFEDEGFYEIRIYAGTLNSISEVENAAKLEEQELDEENNPTGNFGKVVTTTLCYKIEKNSDAPRLKTLAQDGVDGIAELNKLITDTFAGVWQNLPEYLEDFTFPRPDGLFTNGTDEDYTFSFYIGYKHETNPAFTWSSSLSFNISQTGLFVFRFVAKSPTQKTNLDTDFYDEDYPEFEFRFSDVNPPKIELASHLRNQTIKEGDSFSIPAPSLTDAGSASVISDETKLFHGYSGWTVDKGLQNSDGVLLTEVELDDDGKYVFETVGVYYFVAFYRAEDSHNNKTAAFPSDPTKLTEEEKKSFFLITITVEEPETDVNNTLLIILIILGGLSFIGIIVLLFIKPIDESVKKAHRSA